MKSVALPIATAVTGAAVGVLGGAVLNRRQPKRKFLGIPLPAKRANPEKLAREIGANTGKLARQVGEAAAQFGRLASEVQAAREQAAKVGKALS